jgi:hypothetical protein
MREQALAPYEADRRHAAARTVTPPDDPEEIAFAALLDRLMRDIGTTRDVGVLDAAAVGHGRDVRPR